MIRSQWSMSGEWGRQQTGRWILQVNDEQNFVHFFSKRGKMNISRSFPLKSFSTVHFGNRTRILICFPR
jgi:hypothetical protein